MLHDSDRREPVTSRFLLLALIPSVLAAADAPTISPASRNDQNILVHEVRSDFQQGTTQIKVLPPDNLQPDHKYPAIYILPVEANNSARYGDALREVKNQALHNRHAAIFVAPTFSH